MMRLESILPNLLDDELCRDKVFRFLVRLSGLRREAFAAWAGRCRSTSFRSAIEHAVDEAIVLALTVEYLRPRCQDGANTLRSSIQNTNHLSLVNLAECVAKRVRGRQLRQSLRQDACTSRTPVPDDIADQVFTCGVPEALAELDGPLAITVLGDFHQVCMANPLADHRHDVNRRRVKGAHYTPAPLVDYMTARVLPSVLSEPPDSRPLRILDPACGCGAFLVAALRYVISASVRGAPSPHRDGPVCCLYGSDVDHRAVALTRLGLALAAEGGTERDAENATGHPSPRLLVQDFLANGIWQNDIFDLIIGGPPFVRVEQLHKSNARKVREYRERFETARSGQFDLYMPFIEKSISLLRPGGRLAFSVSSSFLRSKSGRRLRDVIGRHCHVEEIIEFEDGNIYPDASVQIAAIFLRRTPNKGLTRYIFLPARVYLRGQLGSLLGTRCRSVNGSRVLWTDLSRRIGCSWNFHSDREQGFVDCVDAISTPLGKLPVDISLGVCTGADGIYILKRRPGLAQGRVKLTTRAGENVDLEAGILRPILRARHSRNIAGTDLQYSCIFPYDHNGTPLAEGQFRAEFPQAYGYLQGHRSRLQRRRLCPSQPWYALRKVDVSRLVVRPKIFAPTFLSEGGFLLDNKGILCHHGILSIAPLAGEINVYYLLGLLNSSLMWRYISLTTAPAGGERRILRIELARKLPTAIPRTQEERALARRIAELARKAAPHRVPECSVRAMINRLVDKLYKV